MKTPITYYGGKQKMVAAILPLIPEHTLYAEPFFGGGAVFFSKPQSKVEVVNDTNGELMNFYKIVKTEFDSLEKEVRATLHSRDAHRKATVIYDNPDLFTPVMRAWALWTLAAQSFSSMLDGTWGYDVIKNTSSKKVANKREAFLSEYADRLKMVQIENTDALRIIRSRDSENSFFYCDPPYFNSDCGHYDGYTPEDFEMLLKQLSNIKGKFLLSSYHSPILKQYTAANGWHQRTFELKASVNKGGNGKQKVEVLTANYNIDTPKNSVHLDLS